MKYPFTSQHDERDCGAACLSMICEYYGKKLPIARFRELIKVDNQGANIYGIVTGAKEICAFVNKKLSHSANKKVSHF